MNRKSRRKRSMSVRQVNKQVWACVCELRVCAYVDSKLMIFSNTGLVLWSNIQRARCIKRGKAIAQQQIFADGIVLRIDDRTRI